jgi:hypothetical protein
MTGRAISLGITGLAAALLAVGCGPAARTETFDIDVRNATAQPLTLSLGKDGPPYEPAWARPEDVAIETPKLREQWVGGQTGMGQVVAPGKTASIRKLAGRFAGEARGYVIVYAGDLSQSISRMLARPADSPDRTDVPLSPGPNRIVIEQVDGRLVAKPDQGPGGTP